MVLTVDLLRSAEAVDTVYRAAPTVAALLVLTEGAVLAVALTRGRAVTGLRASYIATVLFALSYWILPYLGQSAGAVAPWVLTGLAITYVGGLATSLGKGQPKPALPAIFEWVLAAALTLFAVYGGALATMTS
jgi:hypothetical protein